MKSVRQNQTNGGGVLIYQEDNMVVSLADIERICDEAVVIDTYDQDKNRIRTVYFAWDGEVPWVIWERLRERFFTAERPVQYPKLTPEEREEFARECRWLNSQP